jgi:hypothetical protein
MTTYAWPTARHFVPAAQELRVVDNTQRTVESALSGYVQTTAMPGTRWGWAMDFTPHNAAQRAELEAYLLRLNGRQHRVQLWDLKNPRPRGTTMLTGVTLGATAAQFATSLQLAGCRGINLVLGGSFEFDTDSNGLADGWTAVQTGTVSGVVYERSIADPMDGVYEQGIDATFGSLGAVVGIERLVQLPGGPGVYTVRYRVRGGGETQLQRMLIEPRNSSGVVIGSTLVPVSATLPLSGVVQTGTFTAPAGTTQCTVRLEMLAQNTGTVAAIRWDGVAIKAGAVDSSWPAVPTLLAGDWLGLAGGQLVRVVTDAQSDDLGRMTVEVRHMLRQSVASGSAVVLDKPTALYVRTEAGLALPRQPGAIEPGMSIDLVEVFA